MLKVDSLLAIIGPKGTDVNPYLSGGKGIYLPDEGFGVRLEDDVVVQNSGEPINLMKDIPIEIEEIEELMNN